MANNFDPSKDDVRRARHQYTDMVRYYKQRGLSFEGEQLPKSTGNTIQDLSTIQKYKEDLFRKATFVASKAEIDPTTGEVISRTATYKGISAIEAYRGDDSVADIEAIKLARYIQKLDSIYSYIPEKWVSSGGSKKLIASPSAKKWITKNADYVSNLLQNAFSVNAEGTLQRLEKYGEEFDRLVESLTHAYKKDNGGSEQIESIIKIIMGDMTIDEAKELSLAVENMPKSAELAVENLTPSKWDALDDVLNMYEEDYDDEYDE